MNCTGHQKKIAEYLEGLLIEPDRENLEKHLKICRVCRSAFEDSRSLHNRLIQSGQAFAQKRLDNVVMDQIFRVQTIQLRRVGSRGQTKWRRIMQSSITKTATVAAVLVAALVLGVALMGRSARPAYAFEQTVAASHTVSSLYINTSAEPGQASEIWMEFDDAGQLLRGRIEFPESPDGQKSVVFRHDGKVDVWIRDEKKNKNVLVRLWDTDERGAKHLKEMAVGSDPKMAVQRLQHLADQGKVKLEISEATDDSETIIVTATYPEKDGRPGKRELLYVDPQSKLVFEQETYEWVDGEYQLQNWRKYSNYNEPIADEVFQLDAPDDVMRIDQTTQKVGLAKGDMTDEEIAVEVARQFCEALVASDYDTVGVLFEGMPADFLKQRLEQSGIKFIRVVSVGSAQPHPIPETKGVIVPCTVEIETNNGLVEQVYKLGIRPVYSQPDRWTVFGGF